MNALGINLFLDLRMIADTVETQENAEDFVVENNAFTDFHKLLNFEQLHVFDTISSLIASNNSGMFMLNGCAGSGKSFLLNILIDWCKLQNVSFGVFSSTGISCELLKHARTVHSGFKLTVGLSEIIKSNIVEGSNE